VLRDEGLTTARADVGTVVAAPATTPTRRDRDLDRERIVRAATATAITDTRGLAELSMRRIAANLGVATMSLYRYLPAKDDLILARIDAAYTPRSPCRPRVRPGWRAAEIGRRGDQ
jgi:AcrR family transcriptional regulator